MKSKTVMVNLSVETCFLELFLLGCMLMCAIFIAMICRPDRAWANFNTYGGDRCISCHLPTGIPGANMFVAVDGVDETAGDMTINVNAGDTFEIDYYFTGVRGAKDEGVGPEVKIPHTTWTVSSGSAGTEPGSWGAWSNAWDGAAGVGWTVIPNDLTAYTINFDGSGWDFGNTDTACDETTCGAADLDGTADMMGMDVQISVPLSAEGVYTIDLFGVGHEENKRLSEQRTLTVNVAGLPSTTLLPNVKGGADNTGDILSDIQSDDAGAGQWNTSSMTQGDLVYTVAQSNTMFLDGFDVSSIPGGSTIINVILHVQWGVEPGYDGTNQVQWAFDGGVFTNTGIQPSDIGNWSLDETYDLFAQGVDTIAELQTLDIRFINNETGSDDPANFDYLWLEVTYNTAGTLQFTSATYSENESVGTTTTITVSRIGGSSGAVSVDCNTADGTATVADLDYTDISPQTLNWADGYSADKTCEVPINNDTKDENDETVNLSLNNVTGGASIGAQNTAVLTIVDNDFPPTVDFNAASLNGSEGTTPAVIPVSLSAASGKTVTVQYDTANGTAVAPGDYTAVAGGTLTFNPGVTTQNINIAINDDGAPEGDETFTITLSAPSNATLAGTNNPHTYTINDNDAACLRNAPTFTMGVDRTILPADFTAYTLTITNMDTAACADSTWNISIQSETGDTGNFLPSVLSSGTVTIPANSGDSSVTLTVTGNGSGTGGEFLDSTVRIQDNADHSGQDQNDVVRTTIVIVSGDGMLLKRSQEETCHACHKTSSNAPTDANSIKMHSAEWLGTCSNNTYNNRTDCLANGESWTSKWGAPGWGISGGQYGEFLCTTCHKSHDTTNIYLIGETITTPDGSNWGSSGSPDVTVNFRKRSGAAGEPMVNGNMGDDTGGHASSTRVCEVCHSQNKYHNYDTADNTGGTSHENANDCVSCHDHKSGFL